MALAQIGATAKGGVRRLALSDLDRQARDLVCGWFREAGLSLRVDQIGNVFARREGTAPELPAVATGSHIDTQPSGGKFDGNYGVLAGLEVVRCLNDAGIRTKRSVEICIWTNEEGSRFTPVMMGSGVWAGAFSLEQAQQAQDATGMTVLEALRAIGYEGEYACGPSTALGQRWFDVRIQGMDAHAGPTPMDLRQDALLAAAKMVQEVNAIAIAYHPYGRGTVGSLRVEPNSRNVIPGFVQCSVDFRHPNLEGLMAMESRLRDFAHQLAAPYRLGIEIEKVSEFAPCQFSSLCLEAIKESISALGLSSMPIVSGAGHDAVYVARQSPAAMIFIPCKDGISHNEIEDALPEHIEAGANVLLGAMMRLTAQ
ncbi:MAG: Zn-dependent hydrolase [Betaproteobacteria bacterium]|nr:Zn-dependent hydrolase [Betaproteobacteria bacterium]